MRGRPCVFAGFASILAVTIAVHPAVARHSASHRAASGAHERSSKHEPAFVPPYAAIVVDANSGHVLHADKADELRHPASLTKIMTLYLLFEQLEAGKLRLDSQIPVSEHASIQAPTKLGLKPGQSIEIEDAIRGLVTKSANDAAVAVAEAIGGSERDFADMMTLKARALGMSRTVYRNASGLPNDEQVTTARDQALLGRAIQERFPRYYRYFATPSFTYHGQTMRNHNQLLGHVEGMDGIKTGYTQASGFNLVASVRRDNRHIVSVVLGGTSAGARDARMRSLIEEYILAAAPQKTLVASVTSSRPGAARSEEARASETRSPDNTVASRTRGLDSRPAAAPSARATYSVASYGQSPTWPAPSTPASPASGVVTPSPAASEQATTTAAAPTGVVSAPPAAPATDPIKPIQVKTVKVKMAPTQMAALAPPPAAPAPPQAAPAAVVPQASVAEEPRRDPVRDLIAETIRETTPPQSALAPAGLPKVAASSAQSSHSGWMIQVGAFDDEREARERIAAVQAKAGQILKHANPFTEIVTMGDKKLYRARFAGIEKDQAEAICRQLKRNDIACMTIKN